jgi:hypothetical protein
MEDTESKLNPLQMVAREITPHSRLADENLIRRRIMGLISHLHDRATMELESDADSAPALRASQEYLIAVEIVNYFGTQLIAFEDIRIDEGVAN